MGPYPSKSEVVEASRRLSRFAFVGLTDKWEASICAFHSRFKAGQVFDSQLLNVRPTEGIKGVDRALVSKAPARPSGSAGSGTSRGSLFDASIDQTTARLREAALSEGFYDFADAEVYCLAQQMFVRMLPSYKHALRCRSTYS